MPIQVPVSQNYQSPLIAFPYKGDTVPPEGERMIPCEIDWGTMGGANNSVFLNLQNNAVMNFSQIAALSVDNSQCGGDVQFVFPETLETLTIPAYTPKAIVEVFTNQTQFYVIGEGVKSEDITRFVILNFVPAPVVVPISEEQNSAGVNNIVLTPGSSGSTAVIPSTISGTLEALQIFANIGAAASSFVESGWTVTDGAGNLIAAGQSGGSAGGTVGAVNFSQNPMKVRFQQGLNFNWTILGGIYASGGYTVNVLFRTP